MTSMVVYCPAVDDRAEQEELKTLRDKVRANVRRQRVEAAAVEAVTELEAMKAAERRAKRAEHARKVKVRQRNLGYWIGAGVGMLALVAWAFTKDLGITAVPIALGAWILRRK